MNKELLKRVITECSDERSRSNITTDLYCEITEYLEMPDPEPVAWKDATYGNLHHVNYGDSMPLYAEPVDQSARIAELEKDNNITHENLAWYMKKYHEHLTIIAEAAHGIGATE